MTLLIASMLAFVNMNLSRAESPSESIKISRLLDFTKQRPWGFGASYSLFIYAGELHQDIKAAKKGETICTLNLYRYGGQNDDGTLTKEMSQMMRFAEATEFVLGKFTRANAMESLFADEYISANVTTPREVRPAIELDMRCGSFMSKFEISTDLLISHSIKLIHNSLEKKLTPVGNSDSKESESRNWAKPTLDGLYLPDKALCAERITWSSSGNFVVSVSEDNPYYLPQLPCLSKGSTVTFRRLSSDESSAEYIRTDNSTQSMIVVNSYTYLIVNHDERGRIIGNHVLRYYSN